MGTYLPVPTHILFKLVKAEAKYRVPAQGGSGFQNPGMNYILYITPAKTLGPRIWQSMMMATQIWRGEDQSMLRQGVMSAIRWQSTAIRFTISPEVVSLRAEEATRRLFLQQQKQQGLSLNDIVRSHGLLNPVQISIIIPVFNFLGNDKKIFSKGYTLVQRICILKGAVSREKLFS